MDALSADTWTARQPLGSSLEDVNTAAAAQVYLKVNRDTLNRLCRLGMLGYVTVGRERRYTRTHLLDFIARQSVQSAALVNARAAREARKAEPRPRGRPRTTRTFG